MLALARTGQDIPLWGCPLSARDSLSESNGRASSRLRASCCRLPAIQSEM